MKKTKSEFKKVIVRTYSAGVHFGTLEERSGKEVRLSNARRIWKWQGAWTLNEVALNGVGAGSKISSTVPSILLTEAIEIIDCSPTGAASIEAATWAP